ncbi:RNA-binding S4 domain-containing protein [Streptosporangium sp. KLBMP 9127]|nr:RNA-binding S4 domain-containing protein [Streptosporangium sp. KLBMP 9127]
MEETFELETDYITLSDLLKVCGVTDTGGVAKQLIVDGEVMVDGEVEFRKGRKIRPGQVVTGEGFEIDVVAAG